MKTPRQLPSQHEALRIKAQTEQELAVEERQRKDAELRRAFDALHRTDWGRIVWSYFYDKCGAGKSSLARMATGEVAPLTTECKEAQRLIYLEARKLVTPELLAETEFFAEYGTREQKPKEKSKGEAKNG